MSPPRPHSPGLLLAALLVLGTSSCGPDVDSVDSGQLCAEKPLSGECDGRTVLSNNRNGSNILDVVLSNVGAEPATATITLRRPATGAPTGDAGPDAGADTATSANGSTCDRSGDPFPITRTYRRLPPREDASVEDRFVPAEIRTADRLLLELNCFPSDGQDCRVRLEWALSSQSTECETDGDCRASQVCDESFGTCVQCICDRDCAGNRSCNESNGRCEPPSSGCRAADGPPTPLLPAVLFGLVLALGRRRDGSSLLAASLVLFLITSTASAAPPDSSIAFEAGPRWFSGRLGRHTRRGLGARLRQTIRGRYIGGAAWLEGNYFVTSQRPPPLDRQLQAVGFGLGPRAFLPLDDFDLFASVGYTRMVLAPNTLSGEVGGRDNVDTIGGRVGAAYRYYRLKFELAAGARPVLGAASTMWTVDLSVGFTTR